MKKIAPCLWTALVTAILAGAMMFKVGIFVGEHREAAKCSDLIYKIHKDHKAEIDALRGKLPEAHEQAPR